MPLSDLVKSLLEKRGIVSEDEVRAFLQPDYGSLHSPFLMEGIERAIDRTLGAIETGEKIGIYADFDCDGIPGAALLHDFFAKIKYANLEVYIPHRDREGYGLHADALRELAKRGATLVITVDVGTNAIEAIAAAKALGVDVIVTDHHEVTGTLPDAVAILNPKLGAYPFPHLSGTGVAFKFVQALLTRGRERGIDRFCAVAEGWEKWLLDLVAIATVADMVPLIGENRTLAHWGLTVLRRTPRVGLTALCAKLRLRKAEITEEEIGFSIAPRINAASRMDEPMTAFCLLSTSDRMEAEKLADELEHLNSARKGVVAGIVREAKKHVKERFRDDESVIALGNPEWKPALLGLAANSIVGMRGGVACLWGRDASGRIKGSCRSDGSVSVVELFSGAADAFEEYGGHAASGGFTLVSERVHDLHETLSRAAAEVAQAERAIKSAHDALITVREVSWPLYNDLAKLAPFGAGNPKPVFLVRNAAALSVQRFGKEQNHLEINFTCRESGMKVRAYDFYRSADDLAFLPKAGEAASLLATLERDSYRGSLALRIVDVLPA